MLAQDAEAEAVKQNSMCIGAGGASMAKPSGNGVECGDVVLLEPERSSNKTEQNEFNTCMGNEPS